ncbi:MAG: Ig-like domain-containing protein [Myxococcota bacterium]
MRFTKFGYCLAFIAILALGCEKDDGSNNGEAADGGSDMSGSDTTSASGFTLDADPSSAEVRRDGSATVTVTITRGSEFDQPVDVSVVDLPSGVTVSGATIAASSNEVEMTIDADMDAELGSRQATIEAVAGDIEETRPLELVVYDAPTLVETGPAAHAIAAHAGAVISATFDQPMAEANRDNFRVFSNRRGLLDGTYGGGGSETLNFEPADDLLPGEEISVTLTADLAVSQGVSFEDPVVFSFRVASSEAPAETFDQDFKDLAGLNISVFNASLVDLNGDRHLDVLASGRDGLAFCQNNGGEPPAFNCTKIEDSGQRQLHVVADFDADGQSDALVETNASGNANHYQHLCRTEQGDPPSVDCQSTDLLDGDWMEDVAVGDIDQDGDIDILTTTRTPDPGTSEIKRTDDVCFNNGGDPPQFNCQPIDDERTYGYDVELADLDRDGDLDAVLTGFDSAKICENGGGQPVGFSCRDMPELSREKLAVGDMDGDGDVDIVAGNQMCLNQDEDSLSFQCTDIVNLGLVDGPSELADIDGDGDLDLLLGDVAAVCKNGGGSPPSISCSDLDTMRAEYAIDYGDLDSDGDLDIISNSFETRFFYAIQ